MKQDVESLLYKNGDSPKPKSRLPHQMKRVSRACLYCRHRKSKCDLDSSGSPGTPPCKRCSSENRDCVLGSSNRGGRRVRKKNLDKTTNNSNLSNITNTNLMPLDSSISPASPGNQNQYLSPYNNEPYRPRDPIREREPSIDDEEDCASTAESAIGPSVPRNPSDAWQCLRNVANRDGVDGIRANLAAKASREADGTFQTNHSRNSAAPGYKPEPGIYSYRLVQDGSLTRDFVSQLVTRYAENYHPYLPLVPRKYFDPAALDTFASAEKHLLTAVLTIASKDLIDMPQTHQVCSKYMLELISGIAAGVDCDVEAVEALLILAEWEPQGLRPQITTVGRGEEDRAAWMHVGLAVRSGYFLGLDRTSFRGDPAGDAQSDSRKRLAWTSCYISDRLISVRIGRAFWSRGPGPMTGLVSHDFPSLQPLAPHDEDYSKVFQAILDLTQLYGNVHDVLYSGMRTSRHMMLMGEYVKYVDDFRVAISRWQRLWGGLSCSSNIKVMLQMSYEYLKLYTNAFAFQAAISQALSKPKHDAMSQREHLRAAFSNVASMQDARFIYESVEAAKSYLTILNDYVDPEKHLHFMPLRFYLYSIYAAVFLYKARSFGVMNQQEESQVRQMINHTVDRLRQASAGPEDIGCRYARLLELLWKSKGSSNNTSNNNNTTTNKTTHNHTSNSSHPKENNTNGNNNNTTITTNHNPTSHTPTTNHTTNNSPSATGKEPQTHTTDISLAALTNRLPEPTYMQFSPANDFSWLDLEAVGDYVAGDMTSDSILGLTMHAPTAYAIEAHGSMWPVANWGVDMNGNLLF